MIKVASVRVRSFDLSYLDIYWDIAPCYEDLNDYEYKVLRSNNEFGPYQEITPAFRNQTHVRDNTVRGRHSMFSRVYYRVQAKHRTTGETQVFPEIGGAKLAAAPDLAALEMARLNNLRLKEFSGRKVWIFPKRKTGQRCSVCFDRVTQRKLKSNCSACYDTGWHGGFYAPVETYGAITTPDEATQHTEMGNMETQDTSMELGNYPELSEGDVVVEAENIRWRVGSNIAKTCKARAMVKQRAALHRMPVSDIEYLLPLNMSSTEIMGLTATPHKHYTNPQNLSAVDLTTALQNTFGK